MKPYTMFGKYRHRYKTESATRHCTSLYCILKNWIFPMDSKRYNKFEEALCGKRNLIEYNDYSLEVKNDFLL